MDYLLRYEIEIATDRPDALDVCNLIENKIKDFLKEKNYGTSIDCFMHVLRVFFNTLRVPVKQYNRKERAFVLSVNVDPNQFMAADTNGIKKLMGQSIIDALDRYSELRMKPKDFDVETMKKDIQAYLLKENYFQ